LKIVNAVVLRPRAKAIVRTMLAENDGARRKERHA